MGGQLMGKTQHDPRCGSVLELRDLRIAFGDSPAVVDGLDLTIDRGRILCLVGASGSGKSVTALALMRLLPPLARVSFGALHLDGQDLLTAPSGAVERLRGSGIAIVFQDPSQALNPLMTIGDQIAEAQHSRSRAARKAARHDVLSMLDRVRMPGGAERLDLFPHQLSGGMRQRALMAMALICKPALLIADEPTSSLDALVQRQVMHLLHDLRTGPASAVLLISHDILLVHDVADDIAVMFAGRIVEQGLQSEIFDDPQHPYTLALLAASVGEEPGLLEPRPTDRTLSVGPSESSGCRFRSFCPVAIDRCHREPPTLRPVSATHSVACWRAPLESRWP